MAHGVYNIDLFSPIYWIFHSIWQQILVYKRTTTDKNSNYKLQAQHHSNIWLSYFTYNDH